MCLHDFFRSFSLSLRVSSYIFAHSVRFFYFLTQDCSIQQINDIRSIKWKIRKRKRIPFCTEKYFLQRKRASFLRISRLQEYHFRYEMYQGMERQRDRSEKMEFVILFLSICHGKTLPLSSISGINVSLRLKSSFSLWLCVFLFFTQNCFPYPDGIMRLHFIYRKFLLFFSSSQKSTIWGEAVGER